MNASPSDYFLEPFSKWGWRGIRWDWHLVSAINGQILSTSNQRYNTEGDCLKTVNRLSAATGIPVRYVT